MQIFKGFVRVRRVNPGSKSEGTAAWLETAAETEEGRELRMYRKDMPEVGDPLFAELDGLYVTVQGKKETGDYLCVKKLTVVDKPESKKSINSNDK